MICIINSDTIDELNIYVIMCKENRKFIENIFILLNLSFITYVQNVHTM